MIWKNVVPLKVRILMWLVVQNNFRHIIWAKGISELGISVFFAIDIMKQVRIYLFIVHLLVLFGDLDKIVFLLKGLGDLVP